MSNQVFWKGAGVVGITTTVGLLFLSLCQPSKEYPNLPEPKYCSDKVVREVLDCNDDSCAYLFEDGYYDVNEEGYNPGDTLSVCRHEPE